MILLSDSVRYVASFGLPLVASLILTPIAGRWARRLGVMDHPGGHKTHGEATPYLGGLAVAAALIGVGAAVSGASGKLLIVAMGALVLAGVGLADDLQAVSPTVRLALEASGGAALYLVGVRAGLLDNALIDLPVTVLWVVAVTNAFNFVDNMDGLAAGMSALAALAIAIIAGTNGDYLVGSLALAVAGASAGFLRYNFPPARIFLGDAGALMLGFLIAALTLQIDLPVGARVTRILVPVLIVGVPLFDLTLVVLARILRRRPVWIGGRDHSSHRMAGQGLSRRWILMLVLATQALSGLAGAYVAFGTSGEAWFVGGLTVVVWSGLLAYFLRLPAPVEGYS
jgi:UDP-GlcNAc:undecaprenyl-phosphate GlcNAc-1-phosphate transferase